MNPLIGITTERHSDPDRNRSFKRGYTLEFQNHLYPELIRQSGAVPVFLSSGGKREEAASVLRRLDGLLLSGGSDLDPSFWNEAELEPGGDVVPLTEDHRIRTSWEDMLLKEALEIELPVLGICRGMQQMNVSLGGSLYQDLERQLLENGHYETKQPFKKIHRVEVCSEEGQALFGERLFAVTSTHHQAVRETGRDLEVLARAEQRPEVIEALKGKGPVFLAGVQWHPERMAQDRSTLDLLAAFLEAVKLRSGK